MTSEGTVDHSGVLVESWPGVTFRACVWYILQVFELQDKARGGSIADLYTTLH